MQHTNSKNYGHRLGIAEKWHGPGAIMVSNLAMLTSTFTMRRLGGTNDACFKALFLGNLFASLPFLWAILRKREFFNFSTPTEWPITIALSLWATSYVLNYYLLVVFAQDVSITHLIVAESVSPFLAVLAVPQSRRQMILPYDLCKITLGLTLLLSIVFLETPSDNTLHGRSWQLFAGMILLFTISQGAARFIAARRSPAWATARLSCVIAVGLGALLWLFPHKHTAPYSTEVIASALLVGVILIPLNRRSFLFGLAVTPPVIAALFISMTVPLSLLFKFFEEQHVGHKLYSFVLAIAYILMVNYFNSKTKQVKEEVAVSL